MIKSLIDETMERRLENESLEENLCILGVPKIQARAEPEGYNLSHFFVSTYVKKRCGKACNRFYNNYVINI